MPTLRAGDELPAGAPMLARGIAFRGDTRVSRVDFSDDGGKTWQQAHLGRDEDKYSYSQWQTSFTPSVRGAHDLTLPPWLPLPKQPCSFGSTPSHFVVFRTDYRRSNGLPPAPTPPGTPPWRRRGYRARVIARARPP